MYLIKTKINFAGSKYKIFKIITSILVLCVLPGICFTQDTDPDNENDIIGVINGREIKKSEYNKWFLDNFNTPMRMENYISCLLFKKKAEELGIYISEAEKEKILNQKVNEQIEFINRDENLFDNFLKKNKITRDEYIKRLKEQMRFGTIADLYASKIIYKTRGVSGVTILQRFEEKYGREGKKHKLRHIFKNIRPKYINKEDDGYDAAVKRMEEIAENKMDKVVARLVKNGSDYFRYIAFQEEAEDTRIIFQTPVIPHHEYNDKWGNNNNKYNLSNIKNNDITGIIKTQDGYYILKIININNKDVSLEYIHFVIDYNRLPDFSDWAKKENEIIRQFKNIVNTQLKNKNNFDVIAKKYSDTFTSKYGSDISENWLGTYNNGFGEQIRKLKQGDLKILTSSRGVHIVWCEKVIIVECSPELRESIKDEIMSNFADNKEILDLAVELLKEYNVYY